MNSKPTVLVSPDQTVFQTVYLEKLWQPYFNVEILDVNKSYDTRDTVVVSDTLHHENKTNTAECKIAQKGIRHVIDQCWDSWYNQLEGCADFVLRPRYFIWINESVWYKHLGYQKLEFDYKPCHDFLLLMNEEKTHRTQLYQSLENVIDKNIYSYNAKDIGLQNAHDAPHNSTIWQRYVDIDWYNSTRFSIVAESLVDYEHYVDFPNCSEKSLKPCAFRHPSIVLGQQGAQQEMLDQGFATFDHIDYDSVEDYEERFKLVLEYIDLALHNPDLFRDKESQQKIEHNWNHFYDSSTVEKLFKEQMVDPLLEFIES